MGTHWELEGNIERTCWEPRKKGIKSSPYNPAQNLKGKKKINPLVACMYF
jgi:hypothetical protein